MNSLVPENFLTKYRVSLNEGISDVVINELTSRSSVQIPPPLRSMYNTFNGSIDLGFGYEPGYRIWPLEEVIERNSKMSFNGGMLAFADKVVCAYVYLISQEREVFRHLYHEKIADSIPCFLSAITLNPDLE